MIYTPLTAKAMQTAYQAHHGQVDTTGVPYIFHPFHVAEQMTDETSVCAALLHDVAEDTETTIEELEKDFPPEVTQAVRLLTRDPSMNYEDYIRSLKESPTARAVKLADLEHNSDETRLEGTSCTEDTLLYYRKKYSRA
ncbi:MAG: HD domain-containing protein [Clostridiales bacterium]|nr:HD domain-containing protein [Clostridiales bacterium]